jgi:hypothetical protein
MMRQIKGECSNELLLNFKKRVFLKFINRIQR